MLEPGSLVAGKLRVERLLGQGGMGTVYVATHVGLDQQVAIKVLDPQLANNPEIVQRFVREARASARLKSDHVCRVSDVSALEDGVPYIEMELLAGEDLGQLIERAPLAPEIAAEYVLQACVAIAEAHALGIIHRDLKPANLFVTHRIDGGALIKVLDFGIATAPSAQDFKITKTTAVMGSPGYMSPEHLRSARDVDARSDIWALGVILYEAVAGKLPFVAQTITELAVKVVMDEPEPLVGVDPAYAAVVARCLAKEPAQRYQNIAELAADLAPLGSDGAHASAMLVMKLSGGASSSMPIVRPPSASKVLTGPDAHKLGLDTTLAGATGASQTMPPAPKQKRGALIAVAVVVLGGGATAAILASQHAGDDRKHAHHPRDAGAAVAMITPDAALVVVADAGAAAGVDEDQLLIGLGEMEADKNWPGIIRMAGVVSNNPTIMKYVDDARSAYRTEQVAALAAYTKRHDCTSAKTAHDEAIKVLPEGAPDFDKAATCTAAPKPATPLPDANALAERASAELGKGDFQKALADADAALAKDPKNLTALDVAARAACSTGDPAMTDRARGYLAKLEPNDRVVAAQVCKDHGIKFAKPTKPPGSSTQPTKPLDLADVPKELTTAREQFAARNFAAAEKSALRVLGVQPGNREALRVLGLSACTLHHQQYVDQVLAHMPKRAPLAREIRSACEQ